MIEIVSTDSMRFTVFSQFRNHSIGWIRRRAPRGVKCIKMHSGLQKFAKGTYRCMCDSGEPYAGSLALGGVKAWQIWWSEVRAEYIEYFACCNESLFRFEIVARRPEIATRAIRMPESFNSWTVHRTASFNNSTTPGHPTCEFGDYCSFAQRADHWIAITSRR